MRFLAGVIGLCIALTSIGIAAQDDEAKAEFEAVRFVHSDLLVANLSDGTLQRGEGVDMILIAASEEDNIRIKAELVLFSYTEEDQSTPSRIVFEGDVIFELSIATIRSKKAEVDFDAGKVEFTGNPRTDGEMIQGGEHEYIKVDLNTEVIIMGPGKIDRVDLKRSPR